MAAPTIKTSLPVAGGLPTPLTTTTESPGELPSHMSCWNSHHIPHVWPTTPGSSFRINNCEFRCYYCYKDGKYHGKYFSQSKQLRLHVVEAHLETGEFPGVNLLNSRKPRITEFSDVISPRRTRMVKEGYPDPSLNVKFQLTQIAYMLWLRLEYHARFQRLMTICASRHTCNVDDAVVAILHKYGSWFWPDEDNHRNHLAAPAVLLPDHFGSASGPRYSEHSQMCADQKNRFRRKHAGAGPTLYESARRSALGKVVGRYLQILIDMGELRLENQGQYGEQERLLAEIVGRDTTSTTTQPRAFASDGDRDSSPEVPLSLERRKRRRIANERERDSSPEVPLMVTSGRRNTAVLGAQRDSSPEVALRDVCTTARRSMLGPHGSTAEIAHRNAIHDYVSTESSTLECNPARQRNDSGVGSETTTPNQILESSDEAGSASTPGTGLSSVECPNNNSLQSGLPMHTSIGSEIEHRCTNQTPGQGASLPLWDAFLSDALNGRPDTEDNLAAIDAAVAQVPTERLVGVIQELQTSFPDCSSGVSPKSLAGSTFERPFGSISYQSTNQPDAITRRTSIPGTALQSAASIYGPKTVNRPSLDGEQYHVGRHSVPYPGASISHGLRRQIAASSLPRLNIETFQQQSPQPFPIAQRTSLDSFLHSTSAQNQMASSRPAFAPAPSNLSGMSANYAVVPPTRSRICVPQIQRSDLPTLENTTNQELLMARNPLFAQQVEARHRARMETYRRETGGMGGLPIVRQ